MIEVTEKRVTCADCGTQVELAQALPYQEMEALDGDETNLAASNIRHTGRIGYQCFNCLLALEGVTL